MWLEWRICTAELNFEDFFGLFFFPLTICRSFLIATDYYAGPYIFFLAATILHPRSHLTFFLKNFLHECFVQGCIYSVTMNSHTGALYRSHRHRSKSKHKSPVTTVQYRTFSLLARGPVLLTFCRDGSLSFFRLLSINLVFIFNTCNDFRINSILNGWDFQLCSVSLEVQGYLTLRCALKLAPRLHSIRASFCPLLSLEKGEYIGMLPRLSRTKFFSSLNKRA